MRARWGPALRLCLAVLAAGPGSSTRAPAQDFGTPERLGSAGIEWPEDAGGPALLERGLVGSAHGFGAAAVHTRWFGLPELDTRSLAVDGGLRTLRAAAGVSLTGDDALGWRALALGLGLATGDAAAGVALRVRDEPGRLVPAGASPWSGLERSVGGGAWARLVPGARALVTVPRLWSEGRGLPLEPPEGTLLLGEGALSLALGWRQGEDGAAESAIALRLERGPGLLYAGARTSPLRTGVAVRGQWRSAAAACGVELHPVLGTTTRLAIEVTSR